MENILNVDAEADMECVPKAKNGAKWAFCHNNSEVLPVESMPRCVMEVALSEYVLFVVVKGFSFIVYIYLYLNQKKKNWFPHLMLLTKPDLSKTDIQL